MCAKRLTSASITHVNRLRCLVEHALAISSVNLMSSGTSRAVWQRSSVHGISRWQFARA